MPLIQNSPSFFETEYYTLLPDRSAFKIPLPLSAVVRGLTKGQLIATLRKDWAQQEGQTPITKGSLIAFPLRTYLRTHTFSPAKVLFTPDARSSIEEVATGRDAVYAAIFHNVIGSVHTFRPNGESWTDTKLDLPDGGSAGIVSANDWGPEAEFDFQSFLVPPTLYHDDGDDKPKAIKSLPARFDASGLVTEQFEATSKDGTKIPYFVVRQKDAKGPRPTVLYGYGGFEISMTPSYSADFGKLWLTQGGTLRPRQYPRRRRIRPLLARSGAYHQPSEGLRRFRSGGRRPRKARAHHAQAVGHHGWLERRSAGFHCDDATPRSSGRGRLSGAADRHDPLHADRRGRLLGSRVWRSCRSRRCAITSSPIRPIRT